MSQMLAQGVEPLTIDPYEIGWYVESADEEIYGPVSRKSVRRFLTDQTITPNTLLRHCTQPEAKPAADQAMIMDQLELNEVATTVGDRMPEIWPRKYKEQLALAGDSVRCAWHDKSWLKKPATLICIRCHAPYCDSCRAKPFKKQFFMCRRCQSSMYNRRSFALIIDTALYVYLPILAGAWIAGMVASSMGFGSTELTLIVAVLQLFALALMFFRDSISRGAGIGKRLNGLRVVQEKDGTTALTNGQGALRWLSQFIPLFNIADIMIPFRDPRMRRYGDRWAGTRVIDSDKKLKKARAKIAKLLVKKGIQPPPPDEMGMSMAQFARTV